MVGMQSQINRLLAGLPAGDARHPVRHPLGDHDRSTKAALRKQAQGPEHAAVME